MHISMRRIGWIDGGAETLVAAIHKVAGHNCTIAVPTHTTINSKTSRAFRNATRGMTDEQVEQFHQQLPGFDPNSPSSEMGRFADYVLQHHDAVRSSHPLVSFAALGPRAKPLMAVHRLESHLGNESPLAALYRADASLVLLGVGYEACSALHLAEYRLDRPPPYRHYSCLVRGAGSRVLTKQFTAIELDDSDFPALGEDLEAETGIALGKGMVGAAVSRVLPMRGTVDFAVDWMNRHRGERR